MRKILGTFALTALVMSPASAQAQSEPDLGDIASYVALLGTPTAGLAPIATPTMMGAQQTGLGYSFRYGRVSGDDAPSNFGAGVSYGISAGTLGLTAGYLQPGIDDADGHFMLGGHFARGLANVAMSPSAALNIGVDATLGWASRTETSTAGDVDVGLLSAEIGVPVATVAGSGNWRFVPYVQPGLGWGRVSAEDESESGTQFMVGAGLGIMDGTRGIGINVGMKKVFMEDGETVLGLGFSWNPRR